MDQSCNALYAKAITLLTTHVSHRAEVLDPTRAGSRDVTRCIVTALSGDVPAANAQDVAFHVTDWVSDAAFVVALHLFPDRFTSTEIRTGILNLLIHAPNHLAAAAHLAGYPISDVFGVGLKVDAMSGAMPKRQRGHDGGIAAGE